MTTIPLDSSVEYHNIVKTPDGLSVRQAIKTVVSAEADLSPSCSLVYGFSTESATSGDVLHYVFGTRTSVDRTLITGYMLREDGYQLSTFECGDAVAGELTPTHTLYNNQIIVNGVGMPYPLYGFVGGSLVKALVQESINPNTPEIALFPGVVASFADRAVWTISNQVLINDPGIDPRVLTASSIQALPSPVCDAFQAGDGAEFWLVTKKGIFLLPADGLGTGQAFSGFRSEIQTYDAVKSHNAAPSRGRIWGLTTTGAVDLQTLKTVDLSKYRTRRRNGIPVGPGPSSDYRSGNIFTWDKGFVISTDDACLIVDFDRDQAYWVYPVDAVGVAANACKEVVGCLRDSTGELLIISPDGIFTFHGDLSTEEPIPTGYAYTEINTPPFVSPLVTEVQTSADNVGLLQITYVRGSQMTEVTPSSDGQLIIGTGLWGDALREREMRSRRMQRAVRMDSPGVELGFQGGMTRIQNMADIVLSPNQAQRRPTN